MPKISVILTSFNHEKFIREAIDSVLNQTFTDFELIIVDDASSDNSWDLINQYTDPRIKAFRNQLNMGPVVGVNKAIAELAEGEYIAINHSDDVWDLNKLQKQVNFFEANQDIGAVFSNAQPIDDRGAPLADPTHFYYNIFSQPNRSRHEWLRYFFLNGNALCHPSILIRKRCYEDCAPYFDMLAQVPDWDMWVRLCAKHEIHVMAERLIKFRVRDNEMNTSGNRQETRIRSAYEYYKVLQRYKAIVVHDDIFKIFPDFISYDRGENTDAEYVLARVCLESGNFFLRHLLGIEILFDIINNPLRRLAVEKIYHFSLHDFIAITGQYDIFSREEIHALLSAKAEHDRQISGLKQAVAERDGQIVSLKQVIVERDGQIVSLKQVIGERDGQITSLNQTTAKLDGRIDSLKQVIGKRDGQITSLHQAVAERDGQITSLHQAVAERNGHIANFTRIIEEMRESRSWRITAPMRFVFSTVRKARSVIVELPQIWQKRGGLWAMILKTVSIIRNEGMVGVRIRLWRVFSNQEPISIAPISVMEAANQSKLSIVPYYIDPSLDSVAVACSTEVSIAVHLHLYYTEMLEEIISYLNNIPGQYDLYVSVPISCDAIAIQTELKTLLSGARSVVVEPVPNRGRDIAPFIIQFGKRLAQYEIVAHIHSKRSPHNSALVDWCKDILDLLMGPPGSGGGRVAHIIELLQAKAKIFFPEGRTQFIKDRRGWSDNYDLAKYILEQYTEFSISNFPTIEFPEGSMFWARAECLSDLLNLPLSFRDFPEEPISADGTLAHALERLILIFASKHDGQCLRTHKGDSIPDYRHYEEQQNYSSSVIHNDIKVLTYYLPQFHPIPENDLWHGKGFTEWTKVRAANPLFEGHYQQHIPHSDIGYYLLDSPDVLRQQTDLMRQAGVHGQVFYHYWFSGKLILEKTAKLLLDNPDIHMPFCFCWANENWTRRWDGNENEILLGQKYSAQDAHDFIHYLIPFFRDSRYIQVEDRPVLYVYRPSSIPNSEEYLDVWERECVKVGIKRPYVVAVLTRGAVNPKDFGMDAGVERVLNDWTGGAVPDIKKLLHGYWPMNGSVLSYDEVASFYMEQTEAKDFTYFRSLVPIWDNTPRYGSEAYLLHGSTPQRFQEWMKSTIAYTQSTLPLDRRFVLVNAWNEWAEGAHIEPDSRYGYSYLNSVGRALSGMPYSGDLNPSCSIPVGTSVHLSIPDFILDNIRKDHDLKEHFIFCLSRSSIFNICSVSINAPELMNYLPVALRSDSSEADYILEFRRFSVFDPSVIEKMIQTACASGSTVIANVYNNFPLIEITENGSVSSFDAYSAPLLLRPKTAENKGYKNIRMRTDARCIEISPSMQPNIKKPVVTTIIRFHKSANINELRNALYCLSAMMDCAVIPLIAAQDLSKQQIEALNKLLNDIAWTKGCEPQVHLYQSPDGNGDLRSRMLNESLKKVKTRYAAFLDYDDLLMPHAYDWLISRLKKTGKAISFGRVYSTSYDSAKGLLVGRNRTYEYGFSYDEFVNLNHAPLHTFMLDMERLNLSHIVYFDDQRFMEDYLLTLQLFTRENGDWDSLKENYYIGDYIHSVDRAHTLAISEVEERQAILKSPEYIICEQRICDMRKAINSMVGDMKN